MAKQQRRQISPQDDTEEQADTVYKIVEVVGVSEKSWEDAGRNAWRRLRARCVIFGWPR